MSRTGTPTLRLLVLVFIRRCVRLFAWVADHLQFLTFLHTHTHMHTHTFWFHFDVHFILFFPFSFFRWGRVASSKSRANHIKSSWGSIVIVILVLQRERERERERERLMEDVPWPREWVSRGSTGNTYYICSRVLSMYENGFICVRLLNNKW